MCLSPNPVPNSNQKPGYIDFKVLSAVIATRESVKIGFCLITQQPGVRGL